MLAHRRIVDRATVRSKLQDSKSGQAAVTQRTTVRLAAGRTAQRGGPPLSESDQAALFFEFLRWKDQKGTANGRAVEPPRPTLIRLPESAFSHPTTGRA
jgi:hypothetical protein